MLRERMNVKMFPMNGAQGAVTGTEDPEEAMDTVEATKMATVEQAHKKGAERML